MCPRLCYSPLAFAMYARQWYHSHTTPPPSEKKETKEKLSFTVWMFSSLSSDLLYSYSLFLLSYYSLFLLLSSLALLFRVSQRMLVWGQRDDYSNENEEFMTRAAPVFWLSAFSAVWILSLPRRWLNPKDSAFCSRVKLTNLIKLHNFFHSFPGFWARLYRHQRVKKVWPERTWILIKRLPSSAWCYAQYEALGGCQISVSYCYGSE